MHFHWQWLKKFLQLKNKNLEFPQLSDIIDKMERKGFEISFLQKDNQLDSSIRVAKIVELKKHPHADKLSLCQIQKEENGPLYNVVCGATNIRVGQKIPYAAIGTYMPEGFTLKKKKIRSIESEGMLCSLYELFPSQENKEQSDGIWILKEDALMNQKIGDYIKEHSIKVCNEDFIIDFIPPSNRSDLYSYLGLAREIQSIYTDSLKINDQWNLLSLDYHSFFEKIKSQNQNSLSIHINANQSCLDYTACVIRGLDFKKFLSIKNDFQEDILKMQNSSSEFIVDLTNWILFSFGQPMHAFDLEKIVGDVSVEYTKKEEKFIALNNKSYSIPENVLCIRDSEKIIAIAGVIGSKETAVSASTKDVLLETAAFDSKAIHQSIKAIKMLNHKTDSSEYFTRGILRSAIRPSLFVFLRELKKMDPSIELSQFYDFSLNKETLKKEISFPFEEIKEKLGIEIPQDQLSAILLSLAYKIESTDKGIWKVQTPIYRTDIENKMDVYEDILRVFGYDKIQASEVKLPNPIEMYNYKMPFSFEVSKKMQSLKYKEVYNYSFIASKTYENLQKLAFKYPSFLSFPDSSICIEVKNPLSMDQNYLRYSLFFGLLDNLNYNIGHGARSIELFEIGQVFYFNKDGDEKEEKSLAAILYGGNRSLIDLKDSLFQLVSSFVKEDDLSLLYLDDDKALDSSLKESLRFHFFMHKTQGALIKIDDQLIGALGTLSPIFKEEFKWKTLPYFFEINLSLLEKILVEKQKNLIRYEKISDYPSAYRELTIDVSVSTHFQEIEKLILKSSLLLKRCHFSDIFYHSKENKKSLSFFLEFNSLETTLSYDVVNNEFMKIVNQLKKEFNAEVKGT